MPSTTDSLIEKISAHRQMSQLNQHAHLPGDDRYYRFAGMVYAYDIVLAILADEKARNTNA